MVWSGGGGRGGGCSFENFRAVGQFCPFSIGFIPQLWAGVEALGGL